MGAPPINRQREEPWRFYYAASFTPVENHYSNMRTVARLSGWKCTSRWLKESAKHAKMSPADQARMDTADIIDADVFVMSMRNPSTQGGMFVELGIALTRGMQVIIYDPRKALERQYTVFCHMSGVKRVHTIEEVAAFLEGISLVAKQPPEYPNLMAPPIR